MWIGDTKKSWKVGWDVSSEEDVENFDVRVLGSGAVVESLRRQEKLQEKLAPVLSLTQLIERVGTFSNVSSEAINRPGKALLSALADGPVCYLEV